MFESHRPAQAFTVIVALGLLGIGSPMLAAGPQGQPFNGLNPPVNGADVFGGYASNHIIVKVMPGFAPVRLADGRWTFKPAAQPNAGKPPVAANNQSINAIAAATTRRGVMNIAPAITIPPANQALAQQYGLDRYYQIEVPAHTDTPGMIAELAAFANTFESVQLDGVGGIAATIPNDTNFGTQWNMLNTGQSGGTPGADIHATLAWDLTQGVSTITLGMLDTGVQANHPDLTGKVLTGWNIVTSNNSTNDLNGHGTHTSGIAAARGNDSTGVAGVNWNVKILPVVVVNSGGSGTETQCANGVTWATDNGANIISMSLQYYTGATILKDAVAYAYDSGVLPVAATGNFASFGTVSYPAKWPKCMGVGATNRFDALWTGSNTGPQIDVSAPGQDVYSDWLGSTYMTLSGTSMATPHVSGLATLIKTVNPALTPLQIETIIKNTAEDKGAPGFDNSFGWGRINAFAAVQAALPPCPGNTNGDGIVNVDDLLAVINAWGPCPIPPLACPTDIAPAGPPAGNGVVNVDDLLAVINGWGPCP